MKNKKQRFEANDTDYDKFLKFARQFSSGEREGCPLARSYGTPTLSDLSGTSGNARGLHKMKCSSYCLCIRWGGAQLARRRILGGDR